MGLIGERRKQVRENEPKRVWFGDILICRTKRLSTFTYGKKYSACGYHTYCVKQNLGNGNFCFDWLEHVTLKNDYGNKVKVALYSFEVLKETKIKNEYETPLTILSEAHGLIEQKYK